MATWFPMVALGALLASLDAAHAGELADPTRPHGYAATAPAPVPAAAAVDWRLTMIKDAGGRRAALVNGEFVTVGARIGPARVVAIDAYSVELDVDGERRRLNLGAEPIRRGTAADTAPSGAERPDSDAPPGVALHTAQGAFR